MLEICPEFDESQIIQITPFMQIKQETHGMDTHFVYRFGENYVRVRIFKLSNSNSVTFSHKSNCHNATVRSVTKLTDLSDKNVESLFYNKLAVVACKPDQSFFVTFSDRIPMDVLKYWITNPSNTCSLDIKDDNVLIFGNGLSYKDFCCESTIILPPSGSFFDLLRNPFVSVPVLSTGKDLIVYVTTDIADNYVTISTYDSRRFTTKFSSNIRLLRSDDVKERQPLPYEIVRLFDPLILKNEPLQPLNIDFSLGQDMAQNWANVLLCLRSKIAFDPIVKHDAKLLFTNW